MFSHSSFADSSERGSVLSHIPLQKEFFFFFFFSGFTDFLVNLTGLLVNLHNTYK